MSQSTFTLASSSGQDFYFPYPDWGIPSNKITKNTQLFNMWSESDIETVDKGIGSQPLILGGTICIQDPWIGLCIPFCMDAMCFSNKFSGMLTDLKTDMNNGEEFTIDKFPPDELGDCLNGVYVIKNFTLNTIKGTPFCYEWKLELERVKDRIEIPEDSPL